MVTLETNILPVFQFLQKILEHPDLFSKPLIMCSLFQDLPVLAIAIAYLPVLGHCLYPSQA